MSDPDITMSVDDTLELDTIIEELSSSTNTVDVIDGEEGSDFDSNEIRTTTYIFNPSKSGTYTLNVNGQKLTIKVTSSSTLIDNFESLIYEDQNNSLSEYYSGDLSNFERQTSTVIEGNYSARCIAQGGYYSIYSSSDGLPSYPKPGDTIKLRMLIEATDDEDFRFAFGYQDNSNYYAVNISPNKGGYRLIRRDGGTTYKLDSKSMSFSSNVWYNVRIDWGSSGEISAVLEDENGTQQASLSDNDSTFTNGGIALIATAVGGITNDVYWDNIRIE